MTSTAAGLKQVLVVDDDPSVRSGLQWILASTEVEVRTAESLGDAQKIFGEAAIDLVVCDLRLQGLSDTEGFELVSWVRERYPRTASLLMTAFGSPEIRAEALRRGADDYWEKRGSINELLEKIRALEIHAGWPERG